MTNLRLSVHGRAACATWCALAALWGGSACAQTPDISGTYWASEYRAKIAILGGGELPLTAAEDLLEIIMRRYETRSTIMTSNRPLEDWGKLLGDVPSATAILYRFLHHAEIIPMNGRSYRLRNQAQPSTKEEKKAAEEEKPTKEAKPSRRSAEAVTN